MLVLTIVPAAASTVLLERHAVEATAHPECFTGGSPRNPGYDPVTHELYIPNQGNPGVANITVLNETCNLVGTIKLPSGSLPFSAAFDPQDNEMYVTDYALSQVYVISGLKIEGTLSGFGIDAPKGIAYDEYLGDMAIVNSGDDQVTVAAELFNLGRLFFTGTDPYGIAYDPTCPCDMVTNTGSDNVTVYDDYTDSSYSLAVGTAPRGIAYDPASDYDYVANSGSNNLSVLGAAFSYRIPGLDGPYGVAWDQSTLSIWVTNYANGKVFEIGGTNGTTIEKKLSTASDSYPLGLTYDDFNDEMYVTGFDTNVAYVL